MGFLGRALVRAGVWAIGVFYRVERAGPPLPPGPVLIVTNHPNMLTDPLLALHAAGRRVRVLAKAPLFRIPLFGGILRSVDTLPLYRVQDHPDQLHRNRLAFEEAVETLQAGGTVLTFPEGKSHTSPSLAPLKSGAARVTLAAEEESGWRLGVKIVPIGLIYERKHRFRSRVVATAGPAISVADRREQYTGHPMRAVRALTRAVARGLEATTLNVAALSDLALTEIAARLHSRERGRSEAWEGEAWGQRAPRLQRWGRAFAWLREHDPERFASMERSLSRHGQALAALGIRTTDLLPPAESERRRRPLRDGGYLLLALPVAAAGTLAWYLPYFLSGLMDRLMRPPLGTAATVKFLSGFVLCPLTYVAWIALTARLAGIAALGVVALALPPLGLAALRWWDRAGAVREQLVVAFRLGRHPKLARRLGREREALADELNKLAADWAESLELAEGPARALPGKHHVTGRDDGRIG